MNLDDILVKLGRYGRYQIITWLIIATLNSFPSAWHILSFIYVGHEPPHHCQIKKNASMSDYIPKQSDNKTWDSCMVYQNGTKVKCNSWTYDRSVDVKSTVVTEWDLVCDKQFLPELSNIIFSAGIMAGAVIFGHISDRFGRKKTLIFSLFAQALFGIATAFSPNLVLFNIFRFFVGALEQGINITGFILATELFPPKQRSIFAVSHEFLWALGTMGVPLFAYLLRDWRYLQLAISLPSIVGVLAWLIISESVPWLVSQRRINEAEDVLRRVEKFNNKHIGPISLDVEEEEDDDKKSLTHLDLFKTKKLCIVTLCVGGLWFINTLVYYGLSFFVPFWEGDTYFIMMLNCAIEIPSVAVTLVLLYYIGRRWPLIIFHVLAGISCIAAPFIPTSSTNIWAILVGLFGKFCINATFTIVYVYGAELYPTVLRNTGVGFGSMCGRIGYMLFVPVNYLRKFKSQDEALNVAPLIIYGILSLVGCLLVFPLAETKNRPLPETIEHVEHYDDYCAKHALDSKRNNEEVIKLTGTNNPNIE